MKDARGVGSSSTDFSLWNFFPAPWQKIHRLKSVLPKRLPQKFPRNLSDISVKFPRRAPRLLQHGRIEQQRNARDEGSFLFRRLPACAHFSLHVPPRAELRVQRKIAPKLLADLPHSNSARAPERPATRGKKLRSLPSLRSLVCSAVSCRKKQARLRALPQSWPSRSRAQSFQRVRVRARARPEFRGGHSSATYAATKRPTMRSCTSATSMLFASALP